jgi:hypothetical protein
VAGLVKGLIVKDSIIPTHEHFAAQTIYRLAATLHKDAHDGHQLEPADALS